MPVARPPRRLPPQNRPVFSPLEMAPRLRAQLRPLGQDRETALTGRQFIITEWERWPMNKRLAFLHDLTDDWCRDPALAALAVTIMRNSGAIVRDYRAQWAALLAWVQDPQNFYYVNEPSERIQSPQHSINTGTGDCDDAAILLAALGASIRLPFRFVISGVNGKGEKVRWIEGVGPVPPGVQWSHIYVVVGFPPFNPSAWEWAEPTLPGVPLGWDVVDAPKDRNGRVRLPEMEAKPSRLLSGPLGMIESTGRQTSPDAPKPAPAPPAPVAKWRAFAASIPLPQVAATVIAGVLSYVLTQQVIAPRFRARAKPNPRRRRR